MQKARYLRPARPLVQCACCPRLTDEPRDGLCIGCYLRRRRGTALPQAARCTCGVDNPIALVLTRWGVSCLNCKAIRAAGVPLPTERAPAERVA